VISLRESSRKNDQIKICLDTAKGRGVPPWLELDADAFQGTVKQLPDREDIVMPIQEQLIVELYSK
jgi:small subunit ribosomal protein S4